PGAEAAEVPDAQVPSLAVVHADQPGTVGGESLESLLPFGRRARDTDEFTAGRNVEELPAPGHGHHGQEFPVRRETPDALKTPPSPPPAPPVDPPRIPAARQPPAVRAEPRARPPRRQPANERAVRDPPELDRTHRLPPGRHPPAVGAHG